MSRYGIIITTVAVSVILLTGFGSALAEKMAKVGVSKPALYLNDYVEFTVDVAESPYFDMDVYFAMLTPGSPVALFVTPQHTLVPYPVPYTSSWRSGSRMQRTLLSHTCNGLETAGTYQWCGLMVRAGGSIYNPSDYVGEVDMAAFSFNGNAQPAVGMTDWAPREGAVYYTTEPELFARFSGAVNPVSVEQSVEISITSLSSGKTATVRWENGARWAQVDLPEVGTVYQKIEDGSFIAPTWHENNALITYVVGTYSAFGQTFALRRGASYSYTFRLKEGAYFANGQAIPPMDIGPLTFRIAD